MSYISGRKFQGAIEDFTTSDGAIRGLNSSCVVVVSFVSEVSESTTTACRQKNLMVNVPVFISNVSNLSCPYTLGRKLQIKTITSSL